MTSTPRPMGSWSPGSSIRRSEGESQYSSISDFKPDWKLYVGFTALCTLVFAVALDTMSLGTSSPIILKSLVDGTTTEIIWAAISVNLTSTIFSLVFVAFSSIFGRKVMMLIAILFFTAGGITTSFAKNMIMLVAGRTIQGVGSGSIIVLTEVFVTGLVPRKARGPWFAVVNLFWTLGAAAGPVVAGMLARAGLWQWIFRLGVPFATIAALSFPFLLKFQVRNKVAIGQELLKFDWFGLFLFVVSFTTFLVAITLGGIVFPWSSWQVIVLWSIGLSTGLIFSVLQSFFARNPFVRLYLCNNATTAITFLGTYIHGFILWSLLYYLPLYYQAVKGFGPVRSGIAVFPETLTMAVISVFAGILVGRTGKYKWTIFSGWALTTLGISFFMLLDSTTNPAIWVCLNIVVGFGLGILFSSTAVAVNATCTELGQGSAFAVSMLHFFRFMGGTTGIAVSSVIFQSEMGKSIRALQETLPDLAAKASQITNDAIRMSMNIKKFPINERKGLVEAYTDGLKKVWLALVILAVVGTLTCVFAEEYSLEEKKQRDRQSSWTPIGPSPSETPNETPYQSRRPSGQLEV